MKTRSCTKVRATELTQLEKKNKPLDSYFPGKRLTHPPFENPGPGLKNNRALCGYRTVSRRGHFPGSRRIPERVKPGIVSYEKRMKNRHIPPL